MKINIARRHFMRNIKCKVVMAVLSVTVILLSVVSLLLMYLSSNSNITCSSNLEIHNGNLKFSGSMIYDLGSNYGTVTVTGKAFNNNILQSSVSRRVRVSLERDEDTIILTSNSVARDPGDELSSEESRMILPAFTSGVGLSSTYDFYRQLDGSIIISRGTIPIFFCNK